MEALDLTRHKPEEYEGKLIVCNGGEYVVGKHLQTDDRHLVHKLLNLKSKLCLHVVKIVRPPIPPKGMYTKTIASLRSDPELARVVSIPLEIEIPGGRVLLERYIPPPSELEDPDSQLLTQAEGQLDREEYSNAIDTYNRILESNPFHTMAIINLAVAYRRLNELTRARELAAKAVEIEPNCLPYRHSLIAYTANQRLILWAQDLFSETKAIFQDVHDLDELGAELYLLSGNPEKAERYAEDAPLQDSEKDSLRRKIREAIAAKSQAEEMMSRAKAKVEQDDWDGALDILKRAQAVYDKSPILNMNLAFALHRSGDFGRAAVLLTAVSGVVPDSLTLICQANAAFYMIKEGKFDFALELLDTVSFLVSALHTDPPGITIWLSDDSLVQEKTDSASALIDKALANLPPGTSVPPSVTQLAEAYRSAGGLYTLH